MKHLYTTLIFLLLVGITSTNAQTTWYTLASGDWNNSDIWTLDPAGAVPVNPSNQYPDDASDNVVILTGKTVTIPDGLAPYHSPLIDLDNLTCGKLTIYGQLDLRTSQGHSFTELKGNGRLLMEGDHYPTISDDSNFITKGKGEGTVVLYGNDFSISSASRFYNLEINMTTGQSVTLTNDITLNGNLLIKEGILQINDNSSTTILTLTIENDVEVQAGGKILTGKGNTIGTYSIPGNMPTLGEFHTIYHQFIVKGDFKNHGIVKLTNLDAPVYNQFAPNGAVTLRFEGASNNQFLTSDTTDLYNLVIDKGTNRSYSLNIQSDNIAYFRLFGPNNCGRNTGSPFSSADPEVRKALWIHHGTLMLSGSIHIPSLSEGLAVGGNGDYAIGYSGKLLIAGSDVTVYTTANTTNDIPGFTASDPFQATGISSGGSHSALSLFGEFEITNGYFNTGNSYGFVFWNSADPIAKIKGGEVVVEKLYLTGGGSAIYMQTGGKLTKNGGDNFDLSSPDAAFLMSGGEIEIQTGNFLIGAAEGNYSVTGGTVTMTNSSSSINSTANLWNLVIDGNNSLNSELIVSNDLTINASASLSASNNNVSIGGNFTNNGTYTHTGLLKFNSNINSIFTNNNGTLTVPSLKLDKTNNSNTLSFAGSAAFSVTTDLTIQKGDIDLIDNDVSIKGNINLYGGNITSTGIGRINLNGTSKQYLYSKLGKQKSFGPLVLDINTTSPQLELSSNVKVSTLYFERNQIVNTAIYNFEVTTSMSKAPTVSWNYNTSMFRSSGLSSDGGLTLPFVLNGNYSTTSVLYFPIGIYDSGNTPTNRFTPGEAFANGTGLDATGSINMKAVNGAHPTVDPGASVLPYYWSITTSNITGITKDNLRYYLTYDKDLGNGYEKNGSVLTDYVWTEFSNVRSNGDRTYKFPYSAELSKDFTLGKANDYNRVRTIYSRQNGTWSNKSTWSLTSHTGSQLGTNDDLPSDGDRVIIGAGHRVNVNYDGSGGYTTTTIGELVFNHDTTINHGIEDIPRLQIERGNTMNLNKVTGTGMLTQWIDNSRDPNITGDLGDFVNEKYSWFLFVASSGAVDFPTSVAIFPNVMTEGAGRTLTFTEDVVINGSLNPRGNSIILLNNGANGDIHISGDLIIGDWLDGEVCFASSGTSRTISIEGDIDMTVDAWNSAPLTNRKITVLNTTPSSLEHKIILEGNILQGEGTIDLTNSGGSANNAIMEFSGTNSATVSKSESTNPATNFYRIKIDKPSDQKVYFDDDFTINGDASGVTKPLELISGECHLDDPAINIDLASDGNLYSFKIPGESTLKVDNGATVELTGWNTGIWLDGNLVIDNGGKVYCNNGDWNNYIEYSSSGNASIWLGNNAELYVGSQIRRSQYLDVGVLNFTQNSATSTIIIGEDAAPVGTRAVFEILGEGSSFTQVNNANITIVRPQTSASIAALYFDPETVSIGAGAGFTIGDDTTPASPSIGIYGGQNLRNLTIAGSNAPTAQLSIVPLTLDGDLTIDAGTFDANGLDMILKGNITNSGIFNANNNTTYFEGSLDQTIDGATTFYNIVKQTTANTLSIAPASLVTIENDLTINLGNFDTDTNIVVLQGDLINNGITISSGSSEGIVLEGSDVQQIGGSGTYARLKINNNNGVTLPTQSGAITFSDQLNMQDGIFDIGRNLLVIQENATINAINPFSETNMIQTNLSFVDNGIEKYFPVISTNTSFTYPIGSLGKYTPIIFNITANGNNTGSIRVKAADEPHISVPLSDQDEVLQYNWTLDANGITGFSGQALMYSYDGDAIGDTTAYITAKLLLGSTLWNKYSTDDFDGYADATDISSFTFSTTDDAGIDGDYTAGGAIPDQVPSYITITDGSWTTTSTWATYDPITKVTGLPGVDIPAGGPRGSIIYVDNILTFPSNFMAAYRTYINSSGIVNIGSTFGHRLGDVAGTGLITLNNGDLPAGTFANFFGKEGGTIEFSGSTNYDILSEITVVNHLKLSGSGVHRLPNLDFQILGNLTLNGSHVENTHNRNFAIGGDLTFAGGTIDPGTTVDTKIPTITFNGDNLQDISGVVDFSASDGGAFYNFKINNAAGVIISNNIEVMNILNLTNGVIFTDGGGSLTVTNPLSNAVTGGSSASYIQGSIRKSLTNGASFTFPVGDDARYLPIAVEADATSGGIWEAQYYDYNPNIDNYSPNTLTGALNYVSHSQYWRVKAPATANGDVTIQWDASSGVSTDANERLNLRIAEWITGTPDAWNDAGNNIVDGGQNTGTITTSSPSSFNELVSGNIFTIGSITPSTAYVWQGATTQWNLASNWSRDLIPAADAVIEIPTTPSEGSNFPLIDSDSYCLDLTIETGASITVDGAYFEIGGDFVTNGSLIIESDASVSLYGTGQVNSAYGIIINGGVDAVGSFIDAEATTYAGSAQLNYIFDTNQYYYTGNPIKNITTTEYGLPNGGTVNVVLQTFDSTTKKYTNITTGGTLLSSKVSDSNLSSLTGFAVAFRNGAENTTFSGEFFSGNQSIDITSGWNLLTNPYPSSINWDSDAISKTNLEPTLWCRTTLGDNSRGWSTYNPAAPLAARSVNGGSATISMMQAFFVKATTATTFTMANACRTHGSMPLKSAGNSDNVLRLQMENGNKIDEAVIYFSKETTSGKDRGDSEKQLLTASALPQLYSISEQENLVINGLSPLTRKATVPLAYTLGSQNSEIKLVATNANAFDEDYDIVLEDKVTGTFSDLRDNNSYSFTSTAVNNEQRFNIHFKRKVTTGIEQSPQTNSTNIYATASSITITVDPIYYSNSCSFEIFSITGTKVKDGIMETNNETINLNVNTGYYMVSVLTTEGVTTKKVFLKEN